MRLLQGAYRAQPIVPPVHAVERRQSLENVCGEHRTLADLALAAPLTYTEASNLPVTSFASLQTWFSRIQELDAWKKTELAPRPNA